MGAKLRCCLAKRNVRTTQKSQTATTHLRLGKTRRAKCTESCSFSLIVPESPGGGCGICRGEQRPNEVGPVVYSGAVEDVSESRSSD